MLTYSQGYENSTHKDKLPKLHKGLDLGMNYVTVKKELESADKEAGPVDPPPAQSVCKLSSFVKFLRNTIIQ